MKKIWIEYLRVFAVLGVITIHSTARGYNAFDHISQLNWWIANILNSFSRFSVPIFVMISGCVLLGRNLGIKEFYVRRGIRLIPALLFWSFFYIVFEYLFNGKELSSLVLKSLIWGKAYYHLWYLSMLICLMSFAPFINNYLIGRKPTFEDFVYMFAVFALFMSLNQISNIGKEVLKVYMSWFRVFPWFIGYFIMGHFIDVYHDKINIGNKAIIIMLGCILVSSSLLNFYSSATLGIVKDYFILNNSGILLFLVTIAIFYLFSKNRKKLNENYLVSSVSSMSFGIYLIHPFFLAIFHRYLNFYIEGSVAFMPLLVVMTFGFSYVTILILMKLKWFKAVC